jgi:hypothetical protein
VRQPIPHPSSSDKCGNSGCGHTFGKHYTTYDNTAMGCHQKIEGQRDDQFDCHCDGFLIKYYPMKPVEGTEEAKQAEQAVNTVADQLGWKEVKARKPERYRANVRAAVGPEYSHEPYEEVVEDKPDRSDRARMPDADEI